MHFCFVWNMESCMSLVLLFNICAISYALKITPKRRMRACVCVCVREKPCRVVEKHAKAAEQMKRKWEYNGSSQFNVFLWFVEFTSPAIVAHTFATFLNCRPLKEQTPDIQFILSRYDIGIECLKLSEY